jgi:hypothetical protein
MNDFVVIFSVLQHMEREKCSLQFDTTTLFKNVYGIIFVSKHLILGWLWCENA